MSITETKCSSFYKPSAASNMDTHQENEKDVSKVFSFLRSKLNAKEKELLELQRAEPCLLAPDLKQIEMIVDAISSLHLSTQDGSFLFAPRSVPDNCSSTFVCSTGVDEIKALPSTVWLSRSPCVRSEENDKPQLRLPMVTQLLTLPISAFVASSSSSPKLPRFEEPVQIVDEPANRLPAVSQLFSMPIDAFKSTANVQSKSEFPHAGVENTRKIVNSNDDAASRKETPMSILKTEAIYSKEHWLRTSSTSQPEVTSLDLDKYIEQTTEKMRRLHTQYLEALEQLKGPSDSGDRSEALKSMYPNMFDRAKRDTAAPNPTDVPCANK